VSLEILLVVFVGISALALLLQSLSIWQAARSMTQMLHTLDRQSKELQQEASELIGGIQGIVESMAPLSRITENLKTNLDLISDMVKNRAQDLDKFVQEITEISREQSSKVNYVVNDTIQKFEQTTEMLHEDLLKPAVEIASFLKGIKAGLSYLFNKKSPPQSTKSYPEEEMFI